MCDVVERIENRGKADIIRKMLDAKALTVEQIAEHVILCFLRERRC